MMNEDEKKIMMLGEQLGEVESEKLEYIEIDLIRPNPNQPRKIFDESELQELAESIKQYGVLQPIILQPEEEYYTIVAGERRWRACKMVNIKEIPSIIKMPSQKKDLAAISLIENLHRKNLNITEEASYYQQFMQETKCTQEELAKLIGKSRSHVANFIRINNLSNEVKKKIDLGEISLGHAKVLAGQANSDKLAEIIIEKKLNVRETEELIKNIENKGVNQSAPKTKYIKKDSINNTSAEDIKNIEQMIYEVLQSNVTVKMINKNEGKITIKFDSLEALDFILEKIHDAKK